MTIRNRVSIVLIAASLLGCGTSASPMDAATAVDATLGSDAARELDAAVEPDAAAPACESTGPSCVDSQISELDFLDAPSDGAIVEEGTTPGEFLTWIDATGGGLTPTESYVYARFTDDGLEKLDLGDEDALESPDWDIALRRFIVRINSGVAGPSCVTAARTSSGTTFDALTSIPEGLSYRSEAYYTESCELVPDGSGLGSPATALSSFWEYPGCVAMSGNVYVLALASGRHVKLEVVSYYSPDVQAQCESENTITSPSGAGNLRIRWAFLD